VPNTAGLRRQRLSIDGTVWPFVATCLLALASTLLRTAGTDWDLVLVAAAVTALLAAAAAGADRLRARSLAVLALPFAVDGVIALLRQSQGGSTSGYAPLAILPVIWVGLTRGPRSVAAMTACTMLMFAVPIVVVGDPFYPETSWRGVVLWTIVAAAVGFGARRVVSELRRLAALQQERYRSRGRHVWTTQPLTSGHPTADRLSRARPRHHQPPSTPPRSCPR